MTVQKQEQILNYEKAAKDALSLIRRVDKKLIKSVPKGSQYDWLNNTAFNNIIYPRNKIPDNLLRLIEVRNPIVGAIITLRIQQSIEFSHISHDKDVPGWECILKDKDQTLNAQLKQEKHFLETFLFAMNRDDYENPEQRSNDFKTMITKFIRDRYLIDKITWEIERDKKGAAIALWALDGATIFPVLPGGFYGSTSQIGVGINSGFNRLSEEIKKAKMQNIPPLDKIAYIQELIFGMSGGGIVAAFEENDIVYDLGDELTDIRFFKQGLSKVEKANMAIVSFINALTYNANGLSKGAIPKIAIAMGKESGYTQSQLEDAQDEWAANFMAMDGQWNIPLLNSDAKVLNLMNSNREMEYQQYLEFTGALTCAVCGVDAAEIGLRLNQAQNVISENQDAKQQFSKNRGLRNDLGSFSYIVNKFLAKSGFPFAKNWKFVFNGLSTQDKGFEADLRSKNVQYVMTVDEVRKTMDLPPLPNGQGKIILNSVFIQSKQATDMASQQQEGMGGEEIPEEGDDEYADMADEAMKDLEKAVRLI